MKKLVFILIAFFAVLTVNSQTVTYPESLIKSGEALEDVHTTLTANTSLSVTGNGTTITVNGAIKLSYDDLALIIVNGGSISNYQLVVKASESFKDELVHSSCPNRLNAFGDIMTYANYFKFGNVIISGGFMYAITLNYASQILTGSQVAQIAAQIVTHEGSGTASDYILLTTDSEYTSL